MPNAYVALQVRAQMEAEKVEQAKAVERGKERARKLGINIGSTTECLCGAYESHSREMTKTP